MKDENIVPFILGVIHSEGEIYLVILPEGKDAPVEFRNEDLFIDFDRIEKKDICRLWCVNQPVCRHRNLGERSGFERSVSFQAAHLSDHEYNEFARTVNNINIAFLVPDGKGHLQVVYNPQRRNKIRIVGTDAEHHIIRASTQAFPSHYPLCYLVHSDGTRVEQHEIEQYIID